MGWFSRNKDNWFGDGPLEVVPNMEDVIARAQKAGYAVVRGAEGSWDFSGVPYSELEQVVQEIEDSIDEAIKETYEPTATS